MDHQLPSLGATIRVVFLVKVPDERPEELLQSCRARRDANHRQALRSPLCLTPCVSVTNLPGVPVYLGEAELLPHVFQMRCHRSHTLFKVSQLILQVCFFFLHLLQLFKS